MCQYVRMIELFHICNNVTQICQLTLMCHEQLSIHIFVNKLASLEATLVRNYDSLTDGRVECRV